MSADLSPADPANYCRQVETYLCRKNEGHLVRIVGPEFELVCGWADGGVPLRVAFRGIDLYCERYYAKGPQRRPVRIEFCEADVLEAFDEWRRALGVTGPAAGASFAAEEAASPRRPSLGSHVDRLIARLIAVRGGEGRSPRFHELVSATVRELDLLAPHAKRARGEERARIVARLAELDGGLMAVARQQLDPARTAELRREADAELASFGARLAPDAHRRAAEAAFDRLLRETLGIPVLTYE